jgi:hypothetical protein
MGTSLSDIDGADELRGATDGTKIGNASDRLKVDGSFVTQPISVASLPLPSGASTSALQTTTNTNLTTLINEIGATNETVAATDVSTSGLNGLLKRVAQRLTSIFTAQSDGSQQSKIRGNTDGTLIGNIGDRLKVTTSKSVDGRLLYEEANVATGGVARDTVIGSTFTTVYSYTGAGSLVGFVFNLEKSIDEIWEIRVVADSINLLNVDTNLITLVGLTQDYGARCIGIGQNGESVRFSATGSGQPLNFTTSVQIQVRKLTGTKKFKTGIVGIIKS